MKNVLFSVLTPMQQCQGSTSFTAVIFPLSKNVVNFDETLQSHEYYWLEVVHVGTHLIDTV